MSGHQHDMESTLSFEEKMFKLLKHWIKHNLDHTKTYRDWSEKAKNNNMEKTALLLEEAAEMALSINVKFEQAAESLEAKNR